jgi:hypothetical protein
MLNVKVMPGKQGVREGLHITGIRHSSVAGIFEFISVRKFRIT